MLESTTPMELSEEDEMTVLAVPNPHAFVMKNLQAKPNFAYEQRTALFSTARTDNINKADIKIKLLDKNAKIPSLGSAEAAGIDLYASTEAWIHPGETKKINTGIAIQPPAGMVGLVFARSGLATREGLRPANCVGVIDSDYRGEIIVALYNDHYDAKIVQVGDRIAQLVFMPYFKPNFLIAEDLDETERGSGGFGSTGQN